ncbi:ABC transporter permease subunit [Edwardsiella piscicida]|uniref:ABC transporter permease subunit n=1 Tax=Edwardsiella piscicida TaxID=1263550 RepID=UPI0010A5EA3C|nr:ABC transporter permease subunit [Edwardsiella piscicida]ELM3722578.1 ABC transporter permease subunit [Edwardsiella piscicida]ELM3727792.1 ABC transporter permease subunit [Edwardsiella piscicida]ELV7534676.1 ABC transporter permease subunit [Edwardsiella piscicida]
MSRLVLFPALVLLSGALPLAAMVPATLLPLTEQNAGQALLQLLQWPALGRSLALSLWIALGASGGALLLALALAGLTLRRQRQHTLAPALLLAAPHIALATGLLMLLAPTGLLWRLMAPLFDWQQPPDLPLPNDPYGLSLALLLLLKETPFFYLLTLNLAARCAAQRQLRISAALGYPPAQGWWRIVVPQLLPGLRLPMFCVLAFALSALDLAQLLGPQRPLLFAQLLWQWIADGGQTALAALGALLLMLLNALALLLWYGIERLWVAVGRRPPRRRVARGGPAPYAAFWPLALALAAAAYLMLVLISLAQRWPFAQRWPRQWRYDSWLYSVSDWSAPLWHTLCIALAVNLLALILALGTLEWYTLRRRAPGAWLLLPLLLPQMGLIFGLQYFAARSQLLGSYPLVIYGQLLFVTPYYLLTLSGAWLRFDTRQTQVALALGKTPWQAFCRIKLPQMLPALLLAMAFGLAVSVGMYLPTLGLGAGRLPTLATETVAYASGIDRRLAAIGALWQTLLPLPAFLLALWLPLRGIRGATSHGHP